MAPLNLVKAQLTPALDPDFRPAILANRGFRKEVEARALRRRVIPL